MGCWMPLCRVNSSNRISRGRLTLWWRSAAVSAAGLPLSQFSHLRPVSCVGRGGETPHAAAGATPTLLLILVGADNLIDQLSDSDYVLRSRSRQHVCAWARVGPDAVAQVRLG